LSDTPQSRSNTNDIFRDLPPHERARVEQGITDTTYPAGHLFHTPGELCPHLFVLRAGRVQVYKLSSEGRVLRLAVLIPPTVFGEVALSEQQENNSFAEAITECVVGHIPHDMLERILLDYPQVTLRLMELMGQRLHEMENKLVDIAFKSVPQRLATVLLTLAGVPPAGNRPPTASSPTIVRYTHQQLAEMIGSYRETVTKIIGEFREAGLIRVQGDSIYLTNLGRLQQLASEE